MFHLLSCIATALDLYHHLLLLRASRMITMKMDKLHKIQKVLLLTHQSSVQRSHLLILLPPVIPHLRVRVYPRQPPSSRSSQRTAQNRLLERVRIVHLLHPTSSRLGIRAI